MKNLVSAARILSLPKNSTDYAHFVPILHAKIAFIRNLPFLKHIMVSNSEAEFVACVRPNSMSRR